MGGLAERRLGAGKDGPTEKKKRRKRKKDFLGFILHKINFNLLKII